MSETSQGPAQPLDFVVAMWMGMPRDEVLRGLREGWVRPPPGAGPQWLPFSDGAGPDGSPGSEAPAQAADVRRWLARLDDSLDAAGLDRLWREAGDDDSARTAALRRFVADSLGLDVAGGDDSIEAALVRADGTGRIASLRGLGSEALAALAKEHGEVRAALAHHSRWALTGAASLQALSDPTGRFHRFDPDTGELLLSDAWIEDRSRYAAWRWSRDAVGVDAREEDGWRFVDRSQGEESEVLLPASGGAVHQVIFADEAGDHVQGGATTDRIHGGAGDDVLRGRGGRDLLEGGDGDDLLLGGAEGDDLAGGRGDDELEGGSGDDRLSGGSGDDELSGGSGRDLLRGGAGNDLYDLGRGEGIDVVEDDGGTLLVDGVELAGSMAGEGAHWRSGNGALRFRLQGPASDRTLVIAAREGSEIAEVRHWRQGAFGIVLAGLDDNTSEETSSPSLPANPDVGEAAQEGSDDNVGEDAAASDAPPSQPASGGLGWLEVPVPPGLVEWRDVAEALVPGAAGLPGTDAAMGSDANVPTAAAIAEALAGDANADDDGEVVPAAVDALGPPWRRSDAFAAPSPPDVMLRFTR